MLIGLLGAVTVAWMPADILAGIAVIKVFFHPGTRTESAVAELAAVSRTAIRMTRLTR